MSRITRPPHGRNFRIRKGGYVQGLFYREGRRIVRALCKLGEIERDGGGRRRTAAQWDLARRINYTIGWNLGKSKIQGS